MKDRSTPPTFSRPEKSWLLCHSSVSSSTSCCLRLPCSLPDERGVEGKREGEVEKGEVERDEVERGGER